MVIIHAEIHTMDQKNTVIPDGYISMENGIITAVGSMQDDISVSEEVIDAKGKKVYPGYVDVHTHLGMFEDSLCFEGDDGNESTDPVTPQLRAIDGANPLDRCFSEAVRAGVTSVLISPGSTNPIAGEIAAIKTYGKCIDHMIIKSPAAMKFSMGENPKSVYNDKDCTPITRMAIAAVIREQLYKAKKYCTDKTNFENDSANFDEPEYDMKSEALLPLMRGEIPAHFHAHRADDIFTAIRICKEFGIQCVIVHGTDGHLIAEELKGQCLGVFSGPILTDRSKPELHNLTAGSPGIISGSGIRTAIITDHPETPIQYLNLCAAIAVREGMERLTAIRGITSAAAELAGISDRVGSIEVGKDADLVLLETDPLDITRKPYAVITSGVVAVQT